MTTSTSPEPSAMPWYEWRHIRNRLMSFGRAVQGASPYRIELEPDPAKCPTGYTNFSRRLIMVNPAMFPLPPEEQYLLTKAALSHEAGHRRFTTPSRLPAHIHTVSNILEDERMERLMEQEYAGVRGLLRRLSEELLNEARPLDPDSDSPVEVLNHILQLRWAERAALPVKGTLSPMNRKRWAQVEPLVYGAWTAESSTVCDSNAEEIVRILDISEPDIPEWLKKLLEKLEIVEGTRGSKDRAENRAPGGPAPAHDDGGDQKPFDGEAAPDSRGMGVEGHIIEPKPYLALLEKVRPLVQRLVEELAVEYEASSPEASERGGRLSIRQHVREPEKPFILPQDDKPRPPTLTFRVVIDHSTSMNHEDRIDYAAQAAMLMHLAGVELHIPHQIIVTPDDIRIAHLQTGERGLALIAGIAPAQTGWEDTGKAVAVHSAELAAMTEDMKLLIVIHDGMGNDYELLTQECRRLRDRVTILGLDLGMGDVEADLLRGQFGADRYIHCASPEELPQKVGAILSAMRAV